MKLCESMIVLANGETIKPSHIANLAGSRFGADTALVWHYGIKPANRANP